MNRLAKSAATNSTPAKVARTKEDVLVDRVLRLSPRDVRRFVDLLAAHEDGAAVISMLRNALGSKQQALVSHDEDCG